MLLKCYGISEQIEQIRKIYKASLFCKTSHGQNKNTINQEINIESG